MKTLLAATLLLFLGMPVLEAKIYQLSDEKISLEIPDAWVITPKPGVAFSAARPQNQSTVAVLVMSNDQKQSVGDPAFISGMKKGMIETASGQGTKIEFVGEDQVSLNNVPAYNVQYNAVLANGTTIFVRAYAIAANGKIYVISLQTLDSSLDYELQNIASTFKFMSPPELPVVAQNPAYKLGWFAGEVIFVILVLATIGCAIRLLSTHRPKPELPPE